MGQSVSIAPPLPAYSSARPSVTTHRAAAMAAASIAPDPVDVRGAKASPAMTETIASGAKPQARATGRRVRDRRWSTLVPEPGVGLLSCLRPTITPLSPAFNEGPVRCSERPGRSRATARDRETNVDEAEQHGSQVRWRHRARTGEGTGRGG